MMGDKTRGFYDKYRVVRVDGEDVPGRKHHGCRLFVLDVDHDKYAKPALQVYANQCREEYPLLAADLDEMVGAVKVKLSLSVQDEVKALLDAGMVTRLTKAEGRVRGLEEEVEAAREELGRVRGDLQPYKDTVESVHKRLGGTKFDKPGDLRGAVEDMLLQIDVLGRQNDTLSGGLDWASKKIDDAVEALENEQLAHRLTRERHASVAALETEIGFLMQVEKVRFGNDDRRGVSLTLHLRGLGCGAQLTFGFEAARPWLESVSDISDLVGRHARCRDIDGLVELLPW